MHSLIRPAPDDLRGLPTIEVETPEDGTDAYRERARQLGVECRLELKLETPIHKFWLCTRGVPGPDPHAPEWWIVGNVTVEDSDGERRTYGSEDVARLQRLDYFELVRRDLDRLVADDEHELTDEEARQIDQIRKELDVVIPPG